MDGVDRPFLLGKFVTAHNKTRRRCGVRYCFVMVTPVKCAQRRNEVRRDDNSCKGNHDEVMMSCVGAAELSR